MECTVKRKMQKYPGYGKVGKTSVHNKVDSKPQWLFLQIQKKKNHHTKGQGVAKGYNSI